MRPKQQWYGAVYLLHFSAPYHHARHYIGFTAVASDESVIGAIEDRLSQHLDGLGSPLVRAVHSRGIVVTVARVWGNRTRKYERRLKKQHHSRRFCPLCLGSASVRQLALSIPCAA